MITKRPRILVIDDDPLFRSLMSSMLAKDFFVSVSSSGSDGFYRAVEHPPDLAIIDIRMPGWDGLQTLKAFRTHPRLSKIQIVILTSDASKETVMAAIKGGANDYVIKTSLSKDILCAKLHELLNSSQLKTQKESPDIVGTHARTMDTKDPSAENSSVRDNSVLADRASECDQTDADLQELFDSWE